MPTCLCSHSIEEHTDSMAGAPCEAPGCPCTDYQPDPSSAVDLASDAARDARLFDPRD